jgi:hypothetical protein
MRRAALLALAAFAACSSPPPPPAPPEPATVAVELMRGFPATGLDLPPSRAVAIVDASAAMAAKNAEGVTHLAAAKAAALRWLDALPETSALELRALGGERGVTCTTPVRRLGGGDTDMREALYAGLDRLVPAGDASLAESLFDLAAELPRDATPVRVVAWTALRDPCGASLCDAAQALAQHGARLDLVVIGDATVPPCLADIQLNASLFEPPAARPAVGYRVERMGDQPAVWASSEAGGLPVALPAGPARVRVALQPPLVVDRDFEAGSRWVLEIVDFPALDLGERQWRWRPVEAAQAPAEEP